MTGRDMEHLIKESESHVIVLFLFRLLFLLLFLRSRSSSLGSSTSSRGSGSTATTSHGGKLASSSSNQLLHRLSLSLIDDNLYHGRVTLDTNRRKNLLNV